MAGPAGSLSPCFRHTSVAHRRLLPKQNPFSTGIAEDLTMNLEYLEPQYT